MRSKWFSAEIGFKRRKQIQRRFKYVHKWMDFHHLFSSIIYVTFLFKSINSEFDLILIYLEEKKFVSRKLISKWLWLTRSFVCLFKPFSEAGCESGEVFWSWFSSPRRYLLCQSISNIGCYVCIAVPFSGTVRNLELHHLSVYM